MGTLDPQWVPMYLADPQTPPALLQKIAAEYPQYWEQVLRHPNAYPELITWIQQHKILNTATADTAAEVAAPSLAEPPGSIQAGTALPYSAAAATAPVRKKNRKGLVIGLSAGAAGVAVVVASIIGVQHVQEQNRLNAIAMEEGDYDGEGKPEPEVVELPETFLPAREEIELPAGLDDEAFAQAFIERQNNWLNEGNEDILVDRSIEANAEWTEFSTTVSKESATAYAPALFGDEWESNPDVAPYVEKMQLANEGVMRFYVTTAWNRDQQPENIEGYYYIRSVESVRVVSSDETGRTIEISYSNIDNSDKNSHEPYLSPGGTLFITSTVAGGTEIITKISDIDSP